MALYRSAQLPNGSIFSQRKASYLYRLVPSGFAYRDRTLGGAARGMTRAYDHICVISPDKASLVYCIYSSILSYCDTTIERAPLVRMSRGDGRSDIYIKKCCEDQSRRQSGYCAPESLLAPRRCHG